MTPFVWPLLSDIAAQNMLFSASGELGEVVCRVPRTCPGTQSVLEASLTSITALVMPTDHSMW